MFKWHGNQLLFVDIQNHIENLNLTITEKMNFKKNISVDEDYLVFVERQGINSDVVAKLIERCKDVTQTLGTNNQIVAIT